MGFFKNKYPKHVAENPSVAAMIAVTAWEVVKVVVISIAIIVPIRYYLVKPFYVKGASMEPNFHESEYLIIDELTYRFSAPERGDSIVFRYPNDRSQYFIKRVIGLPGERVRISGGDVYIHNDEYPNGIPLEEDYLMAGMTTMGEYDVTLTNDEYFLLGDNRVASLDSRAFGPVQRDDIIGRTLLRGWPLDRFGVVADNLEYNL